MSIGLYGGAFDPPHNGHLIEIQYVLEKRSLDSIILMPANISPLKTESSATGRQRMEMLRLAFGWMNEFTISDFELKHNSISYTIDTLNYLKDHQSSIELIVGYDNYLSFHRWKDFETILSMVTLVVMRRPTFSNKNNNLPSHDSIVFLDTPLIEISSTLIRERVKAGLSIKGYTTGAVIDYIRKNGLYA